MRLVADVLPEAQGRADWSDLSALFRQFRNLPDENADRIREILSDEYSDIMERISHSYVGREAELAEHALAVLMNVDGGEVLSVDAQSEYCGIKFLPGATSGGSNSSVRRSGPYESALETSRRLRDARAFKRICTQTGTAGLLTGSVNYGRFYNVRGNRPQCQASDLDVIVVVGHPDDIGRMGMALLDLPGADSPDVARFAHRAADFIDRSDIDRTVFSHKIHLWSNDMDDPILSRDVVPSEYLLSLHVMTSAALDYILVSSTPRLLKEISGLRRTISDFRSAASGRRDELRDFAGRSHWVDLEEEICKGGYLRTSPAYFIDEDDSYFPGFYQSLFFPRPTELWDEAGIRERIDEFHRKFDERVAYEAGRRGRFGLRPSFAHVRGDAFAPRVVRSIDGAYIGS